MAMILCLFFGFHAMMLGLKIFHALVFGGQKSFTLPPRYLLTVLCNTTADGKANCRATDGQEWGTLLVLMHHHQ